ncbi:MAG: hypothetical protein SFU83_22295 [Meiothermus sp.]|nr:hypothetical protein [Meiothermus sp.]
MSQTTLTAKPSRRTSLVVHLWLESDQGVRASLEETHTGRRLYFSRLEDLSTQLREMAEQLQAAPNRKGIR